MKIKNFLKNLKDIWQTGSIQMILGPIAMIVTLVLMEQNPQNLVATFVSFFLTVVLLMSGMVKISLLETDEEDSNESNNIHPHWY